MLQIISQPILEIITNIGSIDNLEDRTKYIPLRLSLEERKKVFLYYAPFENLLTLKAKTGGGFTKCV
jgi:hypothetical protein